jgi:phospholipase/carboxylesterase
MNRLTEADLTDSQLTQMLLGSKFLNSQISDAAVFGSEWSGPGASATRQPRGRRTWSQPDPRDAEQSLFAPLHYEDGYAYPLVVWLHSDGGDHRELRQVMPHISLRNFVAVAARGSATRVAAGREIDRTSSPRQPSDRQYYWNQTPADVEAAATSVRKCIDSASQRYHVRPDRIFLAGFETGGTMALRLGLAYPQWFAGVLSLEGPMPRGHHPLIRVNEARHLPLMLACCSESTYYQPTRVSEDLKLLHSGGFALSLRQYPGSHDLTTEMLGDINRWIMQQIAQGRSVVC